MPYMYLRLDDDTSTAIRNAAERIQGGSPFLSQLDERAGLGGVPFHVTVLGSLHVYSEEGIGSALERLATAVGPMRGRFVKWECTAATLRCTVEVEHLPAFVNAAHAELPRGRPWRNAHVTVGSCKNIDSAQLAEFLAAVESAFPLTDASVFSVTHVGYQGGEGGAAQPTPAVPLTGMAGGQDLNTAAVKARLAARQKALQEELERRKASPQAGGKGSAAHRLRASAPAFHPKQPSTNLANGHPNAKKASSSLTTGPSATAMEVSHTSSTGRTGIGKKKRRARYQQRGQVAAVVSTRWPGGSWEDKEIAEPHTPRWE